MWDSEGDFSALPAAFHQPAALWKGKQILVLGLPVVDQIIRADKRMSR